MDIKDTRLYVLESKVSTIARNVRFEYCGYLG